MVEVSGAIVRFNHWVFQHSYGHSKSLRNILQGSEIAQEHLQDNFRRVLRLLESPRVYKKKNLRQKAIHKKTRKFVIGDKSLTGCFLKGKGKRKIFR